ncbi:hypothetical protein RND81_01G106600 [Saponaria officinalis]|uniref:SWIM-type domain-containing protein n=1 Tax=Saponaria officinalis TaxID=3572 RepID=A0AAW1NHV8_SAPOF
MASQQQDLDESNDGGNMDFDDNSYSNGGTDEILTCTNDDIDYSGSLVGLKAEESDMIYDMYKKHSQIVGFSTRKATCRRVNGVGTPEIERYFVCSCEGKHGNGVPIASTTQVRNGSITRCHCKASVKLRVNKEGLWEVRQHITEHNHPLTPPQWQHHHRSERKITAAEGEVIKAMTEAQVAPSVQFRAAAAVAGGEVFVGHTKRDHINFVTRLKTLSIEGGDAATLINLLTSRQAEDPGFFFRVQFDEDGRLCHLFWRDSMMKEDYLLYHDVFIFDTTYRTNRYNLICGAFVGINNHWSNVMFGCAFFSDEKSESFEWLFNVFNESMGEDIRPVSIFTDQDQAMSNAIEKIYPATRHRLCQWHIQQNAISHFGSLKHDRTFQNIFNKCLNGCYSEDEFEGTWLKMIKDYGLDDNAWFKRLYNIKTKWCTALNNQFFSAGILSSQRSESTNHAMGFQASKTTSLTEFFDIFETTVKRWRGEEERKEFNCIRSTPTSVYPLVDLLQHASQVYTLELFRVFEKDFALAMGTRAAILPSEDSVLVYRFDSPGAEGSSHHVTFDCDNNLIECTCRKFQVMGMLCSHIISVLHIHSVPEILPTYILRRWSKFSKADVWNRLLPNDMRRSAANDAINWRRSMLTNLNNLVTKCQNMVAARAIIEKICAMANDEVQTLFKNVHMDDDQARDEVRDGAILDHVRCTTKGRSQRKKRNVGKKKAKKCTKNMVDNGASYIAVPRLI